MERIFRSRQNEPAKSGACGGVHPYTHLISPYSPAAGLNLGKGGTGIPGKLGERVGVVVRVPAIQGSRTAGPAVGFIIGVIEFVAAYVDNGFGQVIYATSHHIMGTLESQKWVTVRLYFQQPQLCWMST